MAFDAFIKAAMKAALVGTGAEAIAPGAGAAAGAALGGMDAATAGVSKFHQKLELLTKSFDTFDTKAKEAFGSLTGGAWFESFTKVAMKMADTSAQLQQLTGHVDSLGAAMGGAGGLGINMEKAAGYVGELHNNFAGLTELAPDMMKAVSKQAMGFTRLGIAISDTGKAADIMMKGLRMSTKDMMKEQDKIAKAALALGVAPKKMASDYTKLIPKLLHWGKASTGVFLKLAANAKATGVEMSTLLDVAGKFDTFETAAEQTGKLNMLLGGPYLNTIKMIRADESERLDLLKQSIQMTGKSVEQLGRWRVRDIAKEMGFTNLADFYKEMGAPQSVIDKFTAKLTPAQLAQQNLNKAIGKGVKLSESWGVFFENMATVIGGPFLKVMTRFAKFMMSGEGGKGITQVFGWFAEGITTLLDKWDAMSGPMKETITNFITFTLKMAATSFAVSGFMKIVSPMIQMLTNPASGLIAATTWLIANWDGWGNTIDKLRRQFYNLNTGISDFLETYANDEKWGVLVKPLQELWELISIDIMGQLPDMNSEFGGWQSAWVDFVQTVKDGWSQMAGFFSNLRGEMGQGRNSFEVIITAIKRQIFAFIGDIVVEMERTLINRYGGVIGDLARGEQGIVPDFIASRWDPGGFEVGQRAQWMGALRNANLTEEIGGVTHGASAFAQSGKFRELVNAGDISGAKASSIGKLVASEIKRFQKGDLAGGGFTKANVGIDDFWTDASRVMGFLEHMAATRPKSRNAGTAAEARTPTTFGAEEGLIYAPNGNAYVIAQSLMNQGTQGTQSERADIYLDSEKVGEFIGLGGFNKNISYNHKV